MKKNWTADELGKYFNLSSAEIKLLGKKSGATRLGFGVLLKLFKYYKRFPVSKSEVPKEVISFIAEQLNLSPELFNRFSWKGRSIKTHRAQIRKHYHFRKATVKDADDVRDWLVSNKECYDFEIVMEYTYQRFKELKIEPPTIDRINRIVSSAINNYEIDLFQDIYEKLSDGDLNSINERKFRILWYRVSEIAALYHFLEHKMQVC